LPFAFPSEARNSLLCTGVTPADLLPRSRLYPDLAALGARSVIIGGPECESPYSSVVAAGAEPRPYRSVVEGLVNLGQALRERRGKSYFYYYYDRVDTQNHTYGPDAEQVAAEIDAFWLLFERFFYEPTAPHLRDALLLVVADHGHTDV